VLDDASSEPPPEHAASASTARPAATTFDTFCIAAEASEAGTAARSHGQGAPSRTLIRR